MFPLIFIREINHGHADSHLLPIYFHSAVMMSPAEYNLFRYHGYPRHQLLKGLVEPEELDQAIVTDCIPPHSTSTTSMNILPRKFYVLLSKGWYSK